MNRNYLYEGVECVAPEVLSNNEGLQLIHETAKTLSYYADCNDALLAAETAGHSLYQHSLGVSRHAVEVARPLDISDRSLAVTVLAGLIHDWGKPLLDNTANDKGRFSEHDSLHLESLLRFGGQLEIAQAIRHNPKLVAWDVTHGQASLEQIVVTNADVMTDGRGNKVDPVQRAHDVINRKNIDPEGQIKFVEMMGKLSVPEALDQFQGGNKPRATFVERCDGRYPVSKDPRTHGKVSSLQLARHFDSMGIDAGIIVSGNGETFSIDGVDIKTVTNFTKVSDLVSPESVTYITGWTSFYKRLSAGGYASSLVMRSLLGPSLTHDRLEVMKSAAKQCVLVSPASAEAIGLEPSDITIQGNGFNPEVFFYEDRPIENQIAFVGAPIYEKGLDHLISLANAMPDVKFVIAGDSAMYGRTSEYQDIPQNVDIMGEVSQNDVRDLFLRSAASVFLTDPDRIFETYGKSAMEAALCGTPLVYIQNGGLATTVIKNELNVGFSAFNKDDFIVPLARLVRDKDSLIAQRAALAQQAKDVYPTWREVAARFWAIGNESILSRHTDN